MKLKSSGEMKTVTYTWSAGDIEVEGVSGYVKPSEFEWESQVPAFCAGLAASSSLLSVSISMSCRWRLLWPVLLCWRVKFYSSVFSLSQQCTQVDASSNNLGVEGGKALAECLKRNTTITQVC